MQKDSVVQPPTAARQPHEVRSPHGVRHDDYHWLRDDTRRDPRDHGLGSGRGDDLENHVIGAGGVVLVGLLAIWVAATPGFARRV